MGLCIQSSQARILKVGSLNYSGILTSPYQFFQKHNQQQLLMSNTFRQNVKEIYPYFDVQQSFSWEMGSIDAAWKNRYAPINSVEVGINKETNKMMTQQEFKRQWEKYHQQTRESLKSEHYQKKYESVEKMNQIMNKQIERCRQFDFFCYRTLLQVYCGIYDIKKMGKNQSSEKYRQQKKIDFNKYYLKQMNKINCIQTSLKTNGLDIIFIQQSNLKLVKGLKSSATNYHILNKPDVGSIILIKKTKRFQNCKFQELNQNFLKTYSQRLSKQKDYPSPKQLAKILNFNKDSIFQYLQNILLINVHLASQPKKNAVQLQQFFQQFWRLSKAFPNLQIICGGDFNSKVQVDIMKSKNRIFQKNIQVFPAGKQIFTVKKKRTYMQPQRSKANKMDEKAKDFLISTFPAKKNQVMLMNGKIVSKLQQSPYLPSEQHPYDHLLIYCQYDLQ